MPFVQINWKPTRRTLKQFGWIALGMGIVLSVVLRWLHGLPPVGMAVLVGFGVLALVFGYLWPAAARVLFVGLSLLTAPIGFVLGLVVLAAFYFLILTPVGLVFRLIGRDVLRRRWPDRDPSAWVPHRRTDDMQRYFRQF